MPSVSFSQALRQEYEDLFNSCLIRPQRAREVEQIVGRLVAGRQRYETVCDSCGVPWFVVAVIHNMEASLNFARHLHNGDPLTARTVKVPAGRPRTGQPPFTWEVSCADALGMKSLGSGTDWSLGSTLYQLERYNGWGYRLFHPHVLSPYLWSFSSHYSSGKFIADGRWSDTAPSSQCGAAVLLRRMVEHGEIEFADQPRPAPNAPALVVSFSRTKPRDPEIVRRAEELQRWLNTFPGIFVRVDGHPGERTSNAYKQVTGRFLPGDPRAA